GSMERAIAETERRREKQLAHNAEHGITPMGIQKSVADILDAGYAPGKGGRKRQAVAEPLPSYTAGDLPPKDIWKTISQLEEKMFQAAKDLEFEEAARLRDHIAKLKHEASSLV